MRKKQSILIILCMIILAVFPVRTFAAARISAKSALIHVGSTKKLTVKGAPKKTKVKWSSNKKKIASVTSKGVVKGRKKGTAVITAKVGKKKLTCKVTVTDPPKISMSNITMRVGDTYELSMQGVTAKQKVKWKSDKKKTAAVNSKGKVTAKQAGTATITATVSKKKYTCKVTIKPKETETVQKVVKRDTEEGTASPVIVDDNEPVQQEVDITDGMNATERDVYEKMIAFKTRFYEGRPFTNDNYYQWNGGIFRGGYGCAAFVFMLSDAAFGDALAEQHTNFHQVQVGDIIRMDYNTHSVIVLAKSSNGVIVAEGNYNGSIHWGRQITFSEIEETGTYIMTRYTNATSEQKAAVRRIRHLLPNLYGAAGCEM